MYIWYWKAPTKKYAMTDPFKLICVFANEHVNGAAQTAMYFVNKENLIIFSTISKLHITIIAC